jgi:hypothetical protein
MDTAAQILNLGPGKHELRFSMGRPVIAEAEFVIYYDEQQATGDNGKPVKGDKTGDYEVFVKTNAAAPHDLRRIADVHVSPHGTSPYGNPSAPRYAAERVAEAIIAELESQAQRNELQAS